MTARETGAVEPATGLFSGSTVPEPLGGEGRQWLLQQLAAWPKRVHEDRTCCIGALMDMATAEFCRLMAERPQPTPSATGEIGRDDETYEVGVRDGYEKAIQDIDLLIGGDGEYRYCTNHDPDKHCPDAETMKAKIAQRFEQQAATIAELQDTLEWYAEQAEGCRKLGSIGDPFRHALDADGGKQARATLERTRGQ